MKVDQPGVWCGLTSVIALYLSVQPFSAQVPPIGQPPVPVEPVAAIIDAFKTHALVALSEPHGNEQAYELRLKLLRDPRLRRQLTISSSKPETLVVRT